MTKKTKNIALPAKKRPASKDTKSWSVYRHIKQLKLDKFITAYCDQDLSAIVIKGKPPKQELEKAWSELYEQYIEAIGGNTITVRLKKVKRYLILTNKVLRAKILLDLTQVPQATNLIIQDLKTFGYQISNPTEKNLSQVLKQFQGYLKRDIVELDMLKKDLEKKEDQPETEPQISDFYDTIFDIAEGIKVMVVPETISVLQYCRTVVKYQQFVEAKIKLNKRR